MRGSSLFWRALETARRSNLADAGEPAPVQGSAGLTRRALLGTIAAAGAAAALPRRAHAFSGGRVAIVGGGIAGLTALHHLTRAGVDAHVYEARQRLGGRMFTQHLPGGVSFEVGGQLVDTDHADMHALTREFAIPLIDRKRDPHRTLILDSGEVIDEARIAEALRPIAEQIGTDADRVDRARCHVIGELDRLSIAQYLDRHASLFTAPWVRRLMEATSRTEYGVEPDRASAIELIFNLPTVDGNRFEVLGGADERWVMEGGSGTLVDAMAARYASKIDTGKRLLRIDRAGPSMRLHFLDGSTAEAERVIVAVPAPITRQIDFAVPLPALWRAFIAEMELGQNDKVQAAAGGTPWKPMMGTGGELWHTMPEGFALGWDGSVHRKDGVSPVWCWYLGGEQVTAAAPQTPELLAMNFAIAAEPAVPGLQTATQGGPFRRTGWSRDPLTLGGYVNWRPGQLSRYACLLCVESDKPGERQVSSAGRILFAGEHLSDAWPGYMNGGAQTGRMAAEEILGTRLLTRAA